MNVAEEKVGRREMNAGRITIGFDVWPSMSANNGIPLNIIRELHTINRRLCELGFSGFSPLQVDLFVALRNTAVPSRFLCRRGWGLRSHRSFFKYPCDQPSTGIVYENGVCRNKEHSGDHWALKRRLGLGLHDPVFLPDRIQVALQVRFHSVRA